MARFSFQSRVQTPEVSFILDSVSSSYVGLKHTVSLSVADGIKVDRVDELTRGGFDAQQVAHMVTKVNAP